MRVDVDYEVVLERLRLDCGMREDVARVRLDCDLVELPDLLCCTLLHGVPLGQGGAGAGDLTQWLAQAVCVVGPNAGLELEVRFGRIGL